MEQEKIKLTKEEKAELIEQKILIYKEKIRKLETKKDMILNPEKKKTKKAQLKELLAEIEKSNMSIEEIKRKMGL